MENLFNRLKPEVLELLNQSAEKYPESVKSLKQTLSENISVLELTINDAYMLLWHTTKEGFYLTNLLALFKD
jgi:hypothetical protein